MKWPPFLSMTPISLLERAASSIRLSPGLTRDLHLHEHLPHIDQPQLLLARAKVLAKQPRPARCDLDRV